jgi:small subunit ribosomal protein S2
MPNLMEMLEAGVHFGHKKERSHPRAKDYIFTLREGIYVIDLEKTLSMLEDAVNFLKKEASLGKTILFLGTKRQAKDIIKNIAEKTNMPYVTKRFLGGTLTNFETIQKNITQMENLEAKMKAPEFEELTKKEKKIITDKHQKLFITYDGIRSMKKMPDVLFVIDAGKEALAIAEANKMEIPVVAITDTDANPDKISYPIPANDDAPKSIDLIMKIIEEAITPETQSANVKSQSENEKEKTEENIKTEEVKPEKPKTKKSKSKKATLRQAQGGSK